MRRRRRRPLLTRRPLRVLAALLLADGALVPASELRGLVTMGHTVDQGTLWGHLRTLRHHGVRIDLCQHHGYRLAAMPPDWILDDLLAVVDAVKREWTWWAVWPTCPSLAAA